MLLKHGTDHRSRNRLIIHNQDTEHAVVLSGESRGAAHALSHHLVNGETGEMSGVNLPMNEGGVRITGLKILHQQAKLKVIPGRRANCDLKALSAAEKIP